MIPKIVFSDFDGTLTDGVELTKEIFDILNLLKSKNIPLVIVTGRSKSWAHFFLTHFPVLKAVISEGGGVISRMSDDGLISDEALVSKEVLDQLKHVCHKLEMRFPNLPLTADSFGRQCDRAIDLIDLNKIPMLKDEVEDFFKLEKVSYSYSSVHLNFWCGEISKFKAVEYFIKEIGIDEKDCLYFGDAPNDQSMFNHFSHSVGVSNIQESLDKISIRPKVILQGTENRGPYGVKNYLEKLLK
ncbi:MAG: HAD-IIB family hydrolase [Bdellovibrio sp.]